MNKMTTACSVAVLAAMMVGCGSGSDSSSSSESSTSSSESSSSSVSSVSSSSSSVAPPPFEITSPSFEADGPLPATYSCEGKSFGDGISPEVSWTAGPEGTKSYALAFKDMTIIQSGVQVQNGYHWVMWNIPADTLSMPEDLSTTQFPPEMNGAQQLSANFNNQYAFFGPCPSWNYCSDNMKNTDSYSFVLYALDQETVNPGNSVQSIDQWLENNAIDVVEIRTTSDAAPSCGNQQPGLDGAELFTTNCGTCHVGNGMGSGSSDKTGRTASQIQGAIGFIPQMSHLSSLSSEEIQAIADAL